MGKRADIIVTVTASNAAFNAGAGTQYLVQTPEGVLYFIYNSNVADLYYTKSIDGGLSWSGPILIYTGTLNSLSVWYDRWSGIAGGLIHIAYTEFAGGVNTLYRTIDTENSDTLSTQTVIFDGASAATTGSFLSICRARGGNVYCRTQIDNGTEGGFYRLSNANVPNGAWDAARTINEANASADMMILLPGFAADDQDMIAIFWDSSANEISRQLYDDSANSWSESSISTGMVKPSAATVFPNVAATVDLANSQVIVIAWNGLDTANADLLGWTVTESAITAFTTPVVSNGTDDQGLCAISLDLQTGWWYAFYGGKSDGSETMLTSINVYCKISKDSGTTWGDETLMTNYAFDIVGLYTVPRLYLGPCPFLYFKDLPFTSNADDYVINIEIATSKATYQLGI